MFTSIASSGNSSSIDTSGVRVTGLSLRQAQGLVKDLKEPKPWIYWTDFLCSILCGHALFALLLKSSAWLSGSTAFVLGVQSLLYCGIVVLFLRAVMFTHELVHLPKEGFRGFRIAWNLLCGIPFLVPSFMYYPHVDHHRRKSYGTDEDGEYLNLSHQPPRAILFYMSLILITPLVAIARFGLITPMCWFFPKLRKWTFHRASTMVMDIMYFRPDANKQVHRIRFLQEFGCFAVCMFILFRNPIQGQLYDPLWLQAYLVSIGLLFLNNVRTLGAHRWTGDGSQMSFEEQLLDSCDYPYRPWFTELWGPVGTRYHASHHLFPGIPYHNLGKAHRALMQGLPENSPFRKTVKVSLLSEIAELWRRAQAAERNRKFVPAPTAPEPFPQSSRSSYSDAA